MGSWIGRIFRGDEGQRESAAPLPGSEHEFRPAGEQLSFRVTRTASATDPATGKRVFRSGVGVSTQSRAEAERLAEEQARLVMNEAVSGGKAPLRGYAYLVDRRLEPLIEVLHGVSGESARITVNGYGALVMNAASALFVDVDVEEVASGGRTPSGGIAASGGTSDSPVHRGRDREAMAERPPIELGELLERRPELRFRVYRTRAGWRFLCTSHAFDPMAEEAHVLLTDLGADEKYVVLCRHQKCFRARLTPKPWRAKYRTPSVSATRGLRRTELQRYVDQTWRFATAKHVGGAGYEETAAELRTLVEYHDRWTQAASEKPLA